MMKTKVPPVLVHVLLVSCVALYAVIGALIMQALESGSINSNEMDGGHLVNTLNRSADHYAFDLSVNVDEMTPDELMRLDPKIHECVARVVDKLLETGDCTEESLHYLAIKDLDDCYENADFNSYFLNKFDQTTTENDVVSGVRRKEWSFSDSLIFSFTVITTIGYGNVVPVTTRGRVFCILFGLIGVPLTLITIADLGLFLSKIMKLATRYAIRIAQNLHSKLICAQNMIKERCSMSTKERTDISPEHQQRSDPFKRDIDRDSEVIEYHSAEAITEVDDRDVGEAIAFLITFIIYLLVGSLFLTLYEPEMDYFKAVYFNFVTLTTVGLGDVVPQSTKYLVVTFAYTTVGLALTTISMDIAANYLKQLHYFGRKLKDVEKAVVWFGGQRMTMKSLVKHLGDQFNVPIDQLESLDIGNFVDDAIKVEAGELKTLRKQVPAVSSVKSMHPVCFEDLRRSYESGSLRFVDDKTSTLNSGSELPLADDTARTISSGAPLPAVVEVTSLNSNDSYYGVSSEPFD